MEVKHKLFILIVGFIFMNLNQSYGHVAFDDYKSHPCIRPCGMASPMICEYNFTVEYYFTLTKACNDCPYNKKDCNRPNCVPGDGTRRGLLTVNRMLPGPGIHVCYNDVIVVNVYNRLEGSEGTSIHWHGIHQKGAQFMDGVAMLTQCPILPYSSFQYKFKASTPGTHFWHAHSGMQRSDGIFGQLVVRQPLRMETNSNMYDVDIPEHTVLVNDWFTEMSINKFTQHYMAGGDNKPASILINGKGALQDFTTKNGSIVNCPLEVFNVKYGLRYRFRLVSNGILYCPIQISIDNHNMTVIATDGTPIRPIEVDSITLFSGERYDVIIDASEHVGSYWFRARGDADCRMKKAFQLAILRYDGTNTTTPNELIGYDHGYRQGRNSLNHKGDENHIPVSILESKLDDDDALKAIPDKKFYLAMDFYSLKDARFGDPPNYPMSDGASHHTRIPQINHITNALPPSPALSQFSDIPKELICNSEILSNKTHCEKKYCECIHVLKVSLGDTVELVLIDEGKAYDANHPMHLHGNYFRVIGMDKLNTSTSLAEVKRLDDHGLLKRNLTRRVAKDTVTVPDGGYTIVRFHATNPGFWFFHCHIEFHAEIGMGLIFQVGEISEHPRIPKNFPKCGSWHFIGY